MGSYRSRSTPFWLNRVRILYSFIPFAFGRSGGFASIGAAGASRVSFSGGTTHEAAAWASDGFFSRCHLPGCTSIAVTLGAGRPGSKLSMYPMHVRFRWRKLTRAPVPSSGRAYGSSARVGLAGGVWAIAKSRSASALSFSPGSRTGRHVSDGSQHFPSRSYIAAMLCFWKARFHAVSILSADTVRTSPRWVVYT